VTPSVRSLVRRLLPPGVRRAVVARLGLEKHPRWMFSRIYADAEWGSSNDGFYSGDGSHEPSVVEPYVAALRRYLAEVPEPVNLVDLGCGDFNVGRRLIDVANQTVACDVVPDLIARNRSRFVDPRVTFRVVDAVSDELPEGNVVCVRQVLQHLTNAQIETIVGKLHRYSTWIITEHLPCGDFVPNHDKLPGRDIRIDACGSGVVLTAPPFDVRPRREKVLCEVPQWVGIIRTVAYEFED
jgi:hypothetical protein